MTQRSSLESMNEWIIHLITSDGKRKPVGIFFGELNRSQKEVQWVKGGKTTIEVIANTSETQYRDRLAVLHATHQTIFRVVPNQIGISAAFSGERGFVYYFETSGKLMVSGKLRVKYKGEAETYSGRHSLYIDGIAAITIRNGLVVIDCRNGVLYLDETLPEEYRTEMNVVFPKRQPSLRRRTSSEPSKPKDRALAEQKADKDIRRRIILRRDLPTLELMPRRTPVRRTLSDPTAKRERDFAEPYAQQPIVRRSRSLSIPTETSKPLRDKWTQERDQSGTWYLPTTFFGYPFPTASAEPIDRQQSSRRAITEPITASEREEIEGRYREPVSDDWVEQRDQLGSWFFPKTFFGDIFPSLKRAQQPIEVSDRWIQERDGSGTWFFPKTFPPAADTRRARRTLSEPITKKEKALTLPFDDSTIRQAVQQRRDDDYFRNLHRFYEKPVPKVKVRIPKDRKRGEPNFSEVHEYVVYYSLRPNIKRPNAVLIGKIGAQAIVHPAYQHKRNSGTIRTVLLNLNDSHLLRDAAIVKHSTDLIVVSAIGNAIVKVYGEISGGFGFGNESVLKICGQLIVSRTGSEGCIEGPAIRGISTLTINSGSVEIYICDNNKIIVLDEGLNNFVIKNESAFTFDQKSADVSPVLQTTFRLRDTGYGSGLEDSRQYSSMSSQTQSQSPPQRQSFWAISRTQDL